MLERFNSSVSECLGHAADTEHRAEATSNVQLKADLLSIALRWRKIAQTYQFIEQVDRFLRETKRPGRL